MTDLETAIVGDLPDFDPEEPGPFAALTGVDQANRHLRRIAMLDRLVREKQEQAQRERAVIDAWLDDVTRPMVAERAWRAGAVEQWLRAEHQRGGPKTVNLSAGTARLRAPKPRVELLADVPDELVPERFRRLAWVDKPDISKWTKLGPEVERGDTPEGFRAHLAVDPDGVAVPNVLLYLADDLSFSVTVKP